MQIVVTGGGGVGAAVSRELRSRGHVVQVVDRDPTRADVVGDITSTATGSLAARR